MTQKETVLTSLHSIGMNDHEATVYLALLDRGPSSPTQIEMYVRLHRPLVYKALASLLDQKLVRISPKGKRRLYVAESPDKLIELFKNIETNFLSNIEDLHIMYANPHSPKPTLTYAEGDEAVHESLMDVIKTLDKGDVYYRYSPGSEQFDRTRFLPKKYKEMRDQKQLERFVIVNDDGKKHSIKLGKYVKSVPRSFDLFNDRIGLAIYKNKVLIVDYETQSVITIAHGKFAEFQKKLFKLLFSKL